MPRRYADGEMYRVILWPDAVGEQILGPYDKLSTARGVATQKINARFMYSSAVVPYRIERAMTVWEFVHDHEE